MPLPHYSKLKIRVHLRFEVLFFTLQKSQKHNFPPRTGGLTKRVINFMDSEMLSADTPCQLTQKILKCKRTEPASYCMYRMCYGISKSCLKLCLSQAD